MLMPATAAYSSGTTSSGTCSTALSSAVRAAVSRRDCNSLGEGRLSALQRQQDFIRLYLKGNHEKLTSVPRQVFEEEMLIESCSSLIYFSFHMFFPENNIPSHPLNGN